MAEYFLKDVEARERLEAIEAQLDPGTMRLLEAIGPHDGWHCLEVGGGAGSIARWLCERVGVTGLVVATDLDTRFLDTLDSSNLEVRRHDIVSDELPDRAFDLIHIRAVLEHLQPPLRAQALQRMVASLKPGGLLLAESGDYVSWTPASDLSSERAALFAKASAAFFEALPVDMFYGRRLPADVQAQGLVDVAVEGRVQLIQGGSIPSKVWRIIWATLGKQTVESGALTEQELEDFIGLHDDSGFKWLGPVGIAVLGRRPAG
jgi:SAM-dependent methyltransferase